MINSGNTTQKPLYGDFMDSNLDLFGKKEEVEVLGKVESEIWWCYPQNQIDIKNKMDL